MNWKSTSDLIGLSNAINKSSDSLLFYMYCDALIESGSSASLWDLLGSTIGCYDLGRHDFGRCSSVGHGLGYSSVSGFGDSGAGIFYGYGFGGNAWGYGRSYGVCAGYGLNFLGYASG